MTSLAVHTGNYSIAIANLISMGIVMAFEMVNTAIENLCDIVQPEFDEQIKVIKDVMAGAVQITALVWLVVIVYQLTNLIVFHNELKLYELL